MVVPVLITSCQVPEKLNNGPVTRPRHDDRKGENKHPGPSGFAGCHGCNL
jgi:hypothetical protein